MENYVTNVNMLGFPFWDSSVHGTDGWTDEQTDRGNVLCI